MTPPAPAAAAAPYGLHWFRRDLRVAQNPALDWSRRQHRGRVLGIVCLDQAARARPDFSADRFAFVLGALAALRDELRDAGGDLLVCDDQPLAAFPRLFAALDAAGVRRPATVSWNRDYEPFARACDQAVLARLERAFGVVVHTERDRLIIEPDELRKPVEPAAAPAFYQVFTPFARRWRALIASPRLRDRLSVDRRRPPRFALTWPSLFAGRSPPADCLSRTAAANAALVRVTIPPAGAGAARERLRAFAPKLAGYQAARDVPAADGTSRLSLDFQLGALSPAQVIDALGLADVGPGEASGRAAFLRQLIWREFYCHVLWHRPDVETRAFRPAFRRLRWENREDWFAAWKAGRTGYPIVDAGMRQLDETGWMPNRVRMIVASFLTKDLLVDWRWGERHFMQRLLDGDLAANNGGWQWAASTGCDPQPFFRIFNPTLQARRFDPDGTYIRQHVRERRDAAAPSIHEPAHAIVDHEAQKTRALDVYGAAAGGARLSSPSPRAR